ncbi:MAG: hypothetical protein RR531_04800 [Longicatena sp.]
MSKSIPISGTNAVKIILKDKEDFICTLKNKMDGNNEVTYVFDITYGTYIGTFNFRIKDEEFVAANLNITTLKKVITMDNDANIKKLCDYVFQTYVK